MLQLRVQTSRVLLRGVCLRRHSSGHRAPLFSHSQDEMEAIGAHVGAQHLRAGDVIFLRGDLGCGKTCFARGFIRQLAENAALAVTSPTYLLVNTYELPRSSLLVSHVDLYRLDRVGAQDSAALGLADAFANGISLVEWPERFDSASVPVERLEVHIAYDDDDNDDGCRDSETTGDDVSARRRVSFHPFGARWAQSFAYESK
ncbi:hypothetical protein PybrP1_002445 [[Pythium] brassicae (nom. inval.)]|nr:hypothetical protein PybrP1_002445 [[Pythium] brassicae (nom. inval.)]